MKAIHSMIAALGLAFVLPAPADAGVNDPEIIIYRFPGVLDDANVNGVATVFHCTNFSGATETIRFVTRDFSVNIKGNTSFPIVHLQTTTVSTHDTNAYFNEVLLNTGPVGQGTTAIAATSINFICTAMTIDDANPKPVGVPPARDQVRPGSG
jgi:hypothetical protein